MEKKIIKPEEKKPLIGEATPEEIASWKKKNPLGVHGIVRDGKIAYFKQPGFEEIDAAEDLSYDADGKQKKRTERARVFCDLLWLGGCEELITSPLHLLNVTAQLNAAIDALPTKLVNL